MQACADCAPLGEVEVITLAGKQSVKAQRYRTRRSARPLTISHACGTTYDIAFLDNAYALHEKGDSLPVCSTCKQALAFTRYAEVRKRIDLEHLARHALSSVAGHLARADEQKIPSSEMALKKRIKSWRSTAPVPDPSFGLPDETVLAERLSHPKTSVDLRTRLVDCSTFDAECGVVFTLDMALATAWRAMAAPCLAKYKACMGAFDFCAVDSDDVTLARADAGLRTIGTRLQLVRVAEAFWAEYQDPEK
jgi:hypothetical protein